MTYPLRQLNVSSCSAWGATAFLCPVGAVAESAQAAMTVAAAMRTNSFFTRPPREIQLVSAPSAPGGYRLASSVLARGGKSRIALSSYSSQAWTLGMGDR